MPRTASVSRLSAVVALAGAMLAACALPVAAQQAQPSKPPAQAAPSVKPVESQPLPPLPGAPAAPPSAPAAQAPAITPAPAPSASAPAPAQAPAPPPSATAQQPAPPPPVAVAPSVPAGETITLAPAPTDPSTPDEVTLESRPAATAQASATWDEGYDALTGAFARLQSEMGKAGIRVIGKPLSVFLETDDNGFKFEAQLPIERAPAVRPPALPADIGFGQTPAGRAIRFVHRSPYDDIDSTYEAISAYLDAKGIEVKDSFTEEYAQLGANAGDAGLEINIYVQPK